MDGSTTAVAVANRPSPNASPPNASEPRMMAGSRPMNATPPASATPEKSTPRMSGPARRGSLSPACASTGTGASCAQARPSVRRRPCESHSICHMFIYRVLEELTAQRYSRRSAPPHAACATRLARPPGARLDSAGEHRGAGGRAPKSEASTKAPSAGAATAPQPRRSTKSATRRRCARASSSARASCRRANATCAAQARQVLLGYVP